MYTWSDELSEIQHGRATSNTKVSSSRLIQLLDTWLYYQESIERVNNCSITYISRLLYPFARLLQEQPNLENKIIFISDTRWLKPALKEVDNLPLSFFRSTNKCTDSTSLYIHERAEHYYHYKPQNIKTMLNVLMPKSSNLKHKLKQSLTVLFRTKSRFLNWFLTYFVPYRGYDIFVKLSWADKKRKVAKISIGRIRIPFMGIHANQLKVAYEIKNYKQLQTEYNQKEIAKFYYDLYVMNKRIFSMNELPYHVEYKEGLFDPLDICPILDGYVDIERESFLQDTFFGRLVFRFFKFFQQKRSFTQYTTNDLLELECYLKGKFNNLEKVLTNCSQYTGL